MVPTPATLYRVLLQAYGPQGWWPLLDVDGTNPTKSGSVTGYHVGVYDYPRNERQRFEICVGAILTQNTAWPNVERALRNLAALDALTADSLLSLETNVLRSAIRPSGYYNTKARKLVEFAQFFRDRGTGVPARDRLLAIWGVGPETADSMLLYAYRIPEMVVDAYTRRILEHLRMVPPGLGYEALKAFCVRELSRDVIVYQEFHALMVEHAKREYRRKPYHDSVFESVVASAASGREKSRARQ